MTKSIKSKEQVKSKKKLQPNVKAKLQPKDILVCLVLSKEHLDLSIQEAKVLMQKNLSASGFKMELNLLFAKIPEPNLNQIQTLNKLAYSKKCILILNSNNSCAEISSQTKSNLSNLIDEMYLKKLLKLSGLEKSTKPQSSFKISTLYLNQEPLQKFDVEQLASKVAKEYKYFKVNLKKPDIEFLAVLAKKAYFGATIWESSDNFDSRRADKRPAPHPTSMSPKLARAMINLASPNKEVLDPFCGSGGILLEGGIIGLNVIGIDIDKPMIERATLNLKYFHIKKFKLITDDSLKRPVSAECIVTDVPYGRSSKLDGTVIKLVSSFLQTYRSKTKKIVIACPDYIGMKKIAKKCGWTQEFKTSIYIHSNLTREIWVLRKSD